MGSPSRRTRERPRVPGIQRCISSIPEVSSSSSSRVEAPDFSCHKRTERYIFIHFNSQNKADSHYMQIKPSSWGSAGHHYRLGSALCTDSRESWQGFSQITVWLFSARLRRAHVKVWKVFARLQARKNLPHFHETGSR